MRSESQLRIARLDDLESIIEIYNHAVLTSTATFDTEVRSKVDASIWFKEHTERFPILVAEGNGRILGWGAISPWSPRKAYSITGETSLYVLTEMQGKGIGTNLLAELIRLATLFKFHSLMARIVGDNQGSIRLHERFGYALIGTMREAGCKFDALLDVNLMQKML